MNIFTAKLPPGDAGTDATIEAMRAVVHHAAATDLLREWAGKLGLLGAGPVLAGMLVFGWAKRYLRFGADPFGKELVRQPRDILATVTRQGYAVVDCDDLATVAASLLSAAGYASVFVVVARRPDIPFEHVYFGVRVAGAVFHLDPQEMTRAGDKINAARSRVYDA